MKHALRLAILVLAVVGAYVSVAAPAMADGNPVPSCAVGTKICR